MKREMKRTASELRRARRNIERVCRKILQVMEVSGKLVLIPIWPRFCKKMECIRTARDILQIHRLALLIFTGRRVDTQATQGTRKLDHGSIFPVEMVPDWRW